MMFRLLENAFKSQKKDSTHFYSCPWARTSSTKAAFFGKSIPPRRKCEETVNTIYNRLLVFNDVKCNFHRHFNLRDVESCH